MPEDFESGRKHNGMTSPVSGDGRDVDVAGPPQGQGGDYIHGIFPLTPPRLLVVHPGDFDGFT